MELTAWIDMLIVELPALWHCLRDNLYPASFLTNALGFGQDFCERLPRYLIWFMGLYFLCGGVTLFLHFRKGQKSLNSVAHQINTAILVCCCTLFIPTLVFLAKACVYVLQNEVAPLQGHGDYIRYFGEAVSSVFYIIMAFAGLAFTVWMPISSLFRYLKVYRIRGVPHGIFDVGFGLHLIAVLLLSCVYSDRRLYLLSLPAVVMLGVIQTSGYIPEEENRQLLDSTHPEAAKAAEGRTEASPERSPMEKTD